MNASASFTLVLMLAAAAPVASPVKTGTRVALTGSVKFTGEVPRSQHVSMSADPVCSKLHPRGADMKEVAADQQGDLAGVVVYVSEGLPATNSAPAAAAVTLEQKGCMYQPGIVAVQASQKLKIINDDQTLHNIHALPRNNREWNQAQAPGSSPVEASFAREEVGIPVKCNVHPWMRGYIAVFKHPFFAVTTPDGKFEIRNLPPGQYTLTAWHEKLGTVSRKVNVSAGQPAVADFVFRGATGHARAGE
jgi:plastocyanin